ncbi:TetR/AcrR family transcriptional regulator [Herbiconiux sp. YIM B11900]|uniref:TetR/AcrR family transcriptional regulator n=1 Tax=Herbiconiux sp. YIM B11900 TaxID=3404131 RepID=UPI003F860405
MAERGRPRSEQARHAILLAARDLLAEVGYEQLSIQGIAARAGSGRATVHRWWSSKALIVADLVIAGELDLPRSPVPDSGHLAADLTAWLDGVLVSLAEPRLRAVMLGLVTAASDNEQESRLLYDTSTGPFFRALVERLERGAQLGQIGASGDPEAIAEALIGTVLFRALTPAARPAPASAVVRTLLGGTST